MIIAFDTFLLRERFRNVGMYEYSRNLIQEFREIVDPDGSVTIRYFTLRGYSDEFVLERSFPGCEAVDTKLLRFDRLWRLGLGTVAAKRIKADLIFSPSRSILPLGLVPVAVTIHDAMPERLPQQLLGRKADLRSERVGCWLSAKLSHKILTDSEYSKRDLIEIYDLPSDKVSVVYLGYDKESFNTSAADPEARASVLTRFGIRSHYILHHGMVQLRKNLIRLIQAYRILRDRSPDLDLQLVLAGNYGWGADQIRQLANEPDLCGGVIFTGTLQRSDLAVLVKGASLAVIPSLYEGFCLPMIEAMACGVPTVAANSTCIPEVSGGVLRYFDPLSEEEMAMTMESALRDSELRRTLSKRGLQRASEFSWRRCALETLAALQGVSEAETAPACCTAP
jgi:glycosyltransferase involved in cell wall biosynthesis